MRGGRLDRDDRGSLTSAHLLRSESDTPKHFAVVGSSPSENQLAKALDCRHSQLSPVVAVGIPTKSGKFFVPFLVLVMNHEHKE